MALRSREIELTKKEPKLRQKAAELEPENIEECFGRLMSATRRFYEMIEKGITIDDYINIIEIFGGRVEVREFFVLKYKIYYKDKLHVVNSGWELRLWIMKNLLNDA